MASSCSEAAFKPLVVGAPRTGFALLGSVVIHFVPFARNKWDRRQSLLNLMVERLGGHVSESIAARFEELGIPPEKLLYNRNFRELAGGPKWMHPDRPDVACFRKYFGAPGMGDFTLVIGHPREVLDYHEVVHSHSHPTRWLEHPGYADYTKFASIRNPIGVLNSSCFSINALTSEYIQRFVPPDEDTHRLREDLAVYKLTDLTFFEGLTKFLSEFLAEFVSCKNRYICMKWEDLITNPVDTIKGLARSAGVTIPAQHAQRIWDRLDHVNLTGAHKHNYRAGKGRVGDWKNWLTNAHLDIVRDHGIERYMRELGYGPIRALEESSYTPFQRRIADAILHGEVLDDEEDRDLFGFAFNKSNLDSTKFPFRRYGWRQWTQLERSCFSDENIEMRVWEAAEQATEQLNRLFQAVLDCDLSTPGKGRADLGRVRRGFESSIGRTRGTVYAEAFNAAEQIFLEPSAMPRRRTTRFLRRAIRSMRERAGFSSPVVDPQPEGPGLSPPRLVRSIRDYNIVLFRGLFYGIPHELGDIRLDEESVSRRSGVIVHPALDVVEQVIRAQA